MSNSNSNSPLKPLTKFLNYYTSADGEIWEWKDGKLIILPQKTNNYGYKVVSLLCPDGYRRLLLVHRLVACAWLGYQPNYIRCIHKDKDRINNNVSNLKWGNNEFMG